VAPPDIGKLIPALRVRQFSPNPYAELGSPFFPDRCLAHDATKWTFSSILAFADEWVRRVGVDPVYASVRERLTP
jgi:hypothetical protein